MHKNYNCESPNIDLTPITAKNNKDLTVPEKTELMKQTLTEAYSILPKPHFILCQLEDEFYNHLRINQ